jgi:hypothetical protein
MNTLSTQRPCVGSIILIDGNGTPRNHLALVVNREAGRRWFRRDPVKGIIPGGDEEEKFVFVRYLGWYIPSPLVHHPSVGLLPDGEPSAFLVQRFGLEQTDQRPVLASNHDEVRSLLEHLTVSIGLWGGDDRGMLHGLTMVSQYLTGNACFFPKGYPPMLEELLPRDPKTRCVITDGA